MFLLHVTQVRSELRKTTFNFSAPDSWNKIQQQIKINILLTFNQFRHVISNLPNTTCNFVRKYIVLLFTSFWIVDILHNLLISLPIALCIHFILIWFRAFKFLNFIFYQLFNILKVLALFINFLCNCFYYGCTFTCYCFTMHCFCLTQCHCKWGSPLNDHSSKNKSWLIDGFHFTMFSCALVLTYNRPLASANHS